MEYQMLRRDRSKGAKACKPGCECRTKMSRNLPVRTALHKGEASLVIDTTYYEVLVGGSHLQATIEDGDRSAANNQESQWVTRPQMRLVMDWATRVPIALYVDCGLPTTATLHRRPHRVRICWRETCEALSRLRQGWAGEIPT